MPARQPLHPNTESFAQRMQGAIGARIGMARFQLWFQNHTAFISTGKDVIVGVTSTQFQDWLEQTFGEAIRSAAEEVCGSTLPVRFVVDPALFQSDGSHEKPQTAKPGAHAKPDDELLKAEAKKTQQMNLFGELAPPANRTRCGTKPDSEFEIRRGQPGRRFKVLSDFVIGPCNRVAHASALSVVEDPGQGANPLVFHGPVGTGKTHLLEGIYSGMRKRGSDSRPCYVTAEEFTTRFVQATRFGKQGAFRRQFRECSSLLLDDLHFLATKRATQEEFLHTFDSLVADGRQVVVTTDCHPRLAEELMPELVDRLLGGAVWSLQPPDDETRLGILRQKSGVGNLAIPEDVLKYLARNLRGNVRELEGAVNSVRHFARVTNRTVDQSLVREALGDLLRHTVRAVTVADVDAAVCTVLHLSAGTLQSKGRSWAVSHPRMIAIFLARKHTAATYGEIARYFGAKQHSSAVASEKKVRGWLQKDEKLSLGEREWRAKDLTDRIERELLR